MKGLEKFPITEKNYGFVNSNKTEKIENLDLKISRLGIVARDYRENEGNSDFSQSIDEILKLLDEKGCDGILFSLFTLLRKNTLSEKRLKNLKNVKSLFIEEFEFIKNVRTVTSFKIYFKVNKKWKYREVTQKFATLQYSKIFKRETIDPFLREIKTQRILGNSITLLCGESNVVKYSKSLKKVEDKFGFFDTIDSKVNIILNPIHDKMTRFEMKLKRSFLSHNNRIVISVWNKGKTYSNGNTRDGKLPPWTIYFNGNELELKDENIMLSKNSSKIEIGILDINELPKSPKA
jgi:hypothetical protein